MQFAKCTAKVNEILGFDSFGLFQMQQKTGKIVAYPTRLKNKAELQDQSCQFYAYTVVWNLS